MYRCILTPVDGTAFGEHALPYAATIARRSGATLHLAHVHEPIIAPSGAEAVALRGAWNDLTREEEAGYLEGLAERLARAFNIRVETRVMDGGVTQALERYALDTGAGLVVMSTHAHTGLSRMLHHGVAEQMVRDLPVPVLLVRPQDPDEEPQLAEEPEIRHILVPLDGSAGAEAMLEHAVGLGRAFRARYTLLRVVRPETSIGYTLLGQDGHLNQHQLIREQTAAQQYLNALAERMRTADVDVRVHVPVSHEVANAIVDFVRSVANDPAQRVDLVALEAHPHGTISRMLSTHTTDALVKESPVPVMIFRAAQLTVTSHRASPRIPAAP